MPTTLKDEAAIVGIGETEYSKNSGRSELSLASEACRAAIQDAGLTPADIDGMTTFTMDTSDEIEVAREGNILVVTVLERPSVASIEIEFGEGNSNDSEITTLEHSLDVLAGTHGRFAKRLSECRRRRDFTFDQR